MAAVAEAGVVPVQVEILKNVKFTYLDSAYMFVPEPEETCRSFGPQTKAFIRKLGCWLKSTSDASSHQHLIQRISVAVQSGNAVSVRGSLPFVFQWETWKINFLYSS